MQYILFTFRRCVAMFTFRRCVAMFAEKLTYLRLLLLTFPTFDQMQLRYCNVFEVLRCKNKFEFKFATKSQNLRASQ